MSANSASIENGRALMRRKRVIITGPTSGIGREIARQLAGLGADLVLGCRDRKLGRETADFIRRQRGVEHVTVMHVDTSDQKSIRAFAQEYRHNFSTLDVLINNAGLNRRARRETADGIELTFATNVLGYFLLTQELLDLLKATAPSRIVNVASTYASDLDMDDLEFKRRSYDGRRAYAQSKACDRMLTWAFARRLEGSGVTANAMAPGLIQTRLYRDTQFPIRMLLRAIGVMRGRSVEQGADTAVWLASSPAVEGITGKFFELRKEIPCQFRNVEAEEKLWGICERRTASAG